MTRQQAWSIKQVKEGRCRLCGRIRVDNKQLCNIHAQTERERQRIRMGYERRNYGARSYG